MGCASAPAAVRNDGSITNTTLVTGAGGRLAGLTLAELRRLGVPTRSGSRTPGAGQQRIDFDDPATLHLEGVTTLVLISAGRAEDDVVIARHAAAIGAASRDGVQHIVYTSIAGAGDHLPHAVAHRATEQIIRTSGLDWTILRNGLYAELFGALLEWDNGGLVSPFGTGALAAVARADLAAAAAVVASAPATHAGRQYELVGTPVTAGDVAERLGVPVHDIDLGTYRARIAATEGLEPFQPAMIAGMATNIRHGFLGATGGDLPALIGRPLTDPITVAARTAAALRPGA